MQEPKPTPEQLDDIAQRHGFRGEPIERLATSGVVTSVYAVGSAVVLRVPREHPEGVSDLLTEAVAAPVAHDAGVRTPRVVAFDNTCEILSVPYLIVERIHAASLSREPLAPEAPVLRQLGRELARLHTRVRECSDPNGWLDEQDRIDLDQVQQDLQTAPLSPRHRDLMTTLLFDLEGVKPSPEQALLHGDVHLANLLGTAADLAAIIDWGDAGWGDPAFDLAYLPFATVPEVCEGYGEFLGAGIDCGFRLRALAAHLATAARHMGRPRTPHHRSTGAAELGDLATYLSTSAGRRWVTR